MGAAHLSSGDIVAEFTLRSRVDNVSITQPIFLVMSVLVLHAALSQIR